MYAAPGTAAYAAHGTEQTTMQAHTHTERLTDRDRQIYRQTEKQTSTHTYTHAEEKGHGGQFLAWVRSI